MKKILVTGGTVFVSRYIAEYYVKKGYEVYVLNRNTKPQSDGVILIEADRQEIGDKLKDKHFDVVIDVNVYTDENVNWLLDALGSFDDYVMISSSAVYPEWEKQPFTEETPVGENKFWGMYGINKIRAEETLISRVPNAYILRPPYLYGPMNNVYREAFVFDCAMANRKFYLPKDGELKLHFFYIEDLCEVIDRVVSLKPDNHILNVGNKEAISVKEWVELCYKVAGKEVQFKNVNAQIEQRMYFSFADYEYFLDIGKQTEFMENTMSLEEGLKEAYKWYVNNQDKVNKKSYIEFIDNNF